MYKNLQEIIEEAWNDRDRLKEQEVQNAILAVIELLDKGTLRTAQPVGDSWQVNEWVKKAVIMYFPMQKMETIEVGPFEYHDKIPLKHNYAELGVRVVPSSRSPLRFIYCSRSYHDAFIRKYRSLH